MADRRQQRRIEQLDGDREALEHIARAVAGPRAARPGSLPRCPSGALSASKLLPSAAPASKLLLEAMPAAIGILAGGGSSMPMPPSLMPSATARYEELRGRRARRHPAEGFACWRETGDGADRRRRCADARPRRLKVSFEVRALGDEARHQAAPPGRPEEPDEADADAAPAESVDAEPTRPSRGGSTSSPRSATRCARR